MPGTDGVDWAVVLFNVTFVVIVFYYYEYCCKYCKYCCTYRCELACDYELVLTFARTPTNTASLRLGSTHTRSYSRSILLQYYSLLDPTPSGGRRFTRPLSLGDRYGKATESR
eukprot:707651-Rhodomonas_salina.2